MASLTGTGPTSGDHCRSTVAHSGLFGSDMVYADVDVVRCLSIDITNTEGSFPNFWFF